MRKLNRLKHRPRSEWHGSTLSCNACRAGLLTGDVCLASSADLREPDHGRLLRPALRELGAEIPLATCRTVLVLSLDALCRPSLIRPDRRIAPAQYGFDDDPERGRCTEQAGGPSPLRQRAHQGLGPVPRPSPFGPRTSPGPGDDHPTPSRIASILHVTGRTGWPPR